LDYQIENDKGTWIYESQYAANKYDGLPEDAWIGFSIYSDDTAVSSDGSLHSTRSDFRPFTKEEQKRILLVGACMTCHDETSREILNSLEGDFNDYLHSISRKCILPDFNRVK